MSRSYLVLDIETVPDRAIYNGDSGERAFPPLHAHRPIVVGTLWLGDDYRLRQVGLVGEGKDERGMLEDFSGFVERHQPDLVTYNGRGFDLPVIALRSLRHGIPMSWYYEGRDDARPRRRSALGHHDLCDLLTDNGRGLSLDAVARLIGLPGKFGVDGSQVEGLWNAGQLDAIKSYCLADVVQTALLFLRFRLLQGQLDPVDYRAAASALVASLRGEPRVAPLLAAIDDERLLLAA